MRRFPDLSPACPDRRELADSNERTVPVGWLGFWPYAANLLHPTDPIKYRRSEAVACDDDFEFELVIVDSRNCERGYAFGTSEPSPAAESWRAP
jgi:hypothetical protein